MTHVQVSLHSLRLGELFALALGFGLSTLAVSARIYTNKYLAKTMRMEDYVSVLSWLFFLPYIALAVVIGKQDGSPEHIAHLSSIETAIYSPIIIAVKVSILLQYITIFVTHRGTLFHHAVRGLIWANVLYYIIATVLYVTECSPIQKLWKPTMPGHCLSRHNLGIPSAIMAVISDFSILLLPFPLIWRLQISWKRKSRVFAVFGVGLIACIASILRLVYQIELTRVPPNTPVYQINIDRIGLWAFAEIAIGIIIGCLPSLTRFFKHLISKQDDSTSRFEILSSANRTFWRKLLRRSHSSESSRNESTYYYRTLFVTKNPSKSTEAPYIDTLNLSRGSLHLVEKHLPRMPSPARDKKSSTAASQIDTFSRCSEMDRNQRHGQVADLESAIPPGWT